jgi:DNA (cytosine-5)-methyltransferase 1
MSNPHAWLLSDLPGVQSNGIKVMSTFACGGGSSMGYKRAGCTIIAANDIDPEMAWHYQKNLSPKHYFLCPIQDLLSADLPSDLFDLDILDGSPPCSTFSMAGSREKAWGKDKHFREGQAKQVLSDLFFDYLDLVERLRPKVAIAENVKGMILGNAKGYTKLVMARFRELGYRPQLFLVNAADCGVPQRRERVFFCAIRDDIAAPPLQLAPTHRWISAGEACADLHGAHDAGREKITSAKELAYWTATKKGGSLQEGCIKATGKASWFNNVKLSDTLPACTMSSTFSNFTHWAEPRHLTYLEWKRLGSFPDDYHAKTDNLGKYMIGMSVPPKMTEQVARAVIDQWLQPKGLDA